MQSTYGYAVWLAFCHTVVAGMLLCSLQTRKTEVEPWSFTLLQVYRDCAKKPLKKWVITAL